MTLQEFEESLAILKLYAAGRAEKGICIEQTGKGSAVVYCRYGTMRIDTLAYPISDYMIWRVCKWIDDVVAP